MKTSTRARASLGGYAQEIAAKRLSCPKCKAGPGESCRDPRRKVYVTAIKRVHPERRTQNVTPLKQDEHEEKEIGE